MELFIKRLDKNRFDIFTGNGWSGWTRVQRFHWGVKVIGGSRVSKEVIHEVNQRLVK